MSEEHINCLTGWPQGEEILGYIKRLETENASLSKENEQLRKNRDNAIPILIDTYENSNVYSLPSIRARLDHAIRWLRSR